MTADEASPGGAVPVVVIEPTRGWSALHLRALWEYRELLYFLVWRDLKVRYKQTVLGMAWIVLQPVVSMVVFSLLFGGLLGALISLPVRAQEPAVGWSTPEVLAQTTGTLATSGMALVGDGYGHVHLFFPHKIDESTAGSIDYLTWDGAEWSEPADILVDPGGGNPNTVRAAIDPQQVVHLLFGGQGNWLLHTAAPLAEASSPWAWSEPRTLVVAFPGADLVAGPDGTLYVAYAVYPPNGSIKLISSSDGGQSWTQPVDVAYVGEPETAPNDVRLALDGRGRLHAVWTEYELPNGWPPTGAFYTRSTDGGLTWEFPQRMAEANHGQIGVGTVDEDEVHLVWRSTIGGDGTFHQYSTDGGEFWSIPARYDDRGGFSGLPSFGVDSRGRLHFVTGRVTYGAWDLGHERTYEDLRTEAVTAQATRSAGERGTLAISLGNRLHVVFETDFNKLWYTSKELDAAAVPTVTPVAAAGAPVPTDTPEATEATVAEGATPAPTAGAVAPLEFLDEEAPSEARGPVVGVLAAAVVVGVVLAASVLRMRGRQGR